MSNLTNGSVYPVEDIAKSTDFIGFTFKGTHSSTYNIVRTSNGSRYQEDLLPTSSDQTVQVPGNDGTYLFGTNYTQKPFNISFAFDSLTEQQFRKMRRWLDVKSMGLLILDESPYKGYRVKVSGNSSIQYICFGETGAQRTYKGEGTIQFIAYYPYGICTKKYLNLYDNGNKNEWSGTANLLATQGSYDSTNSANILLYNPGDIPTNFQAYYQFSAGEIALNSIYISTGASTLGQLNFNGPFRAKGNDQYIKIDSVTELIEGCDSNKNPTGNLYNEYISTGEFFQIPLVENTTDTVRFISNTANCQQLVYNYLYF